MPFPYEVAVDMPGSIDETDGTKISSGKVKWSMQGLRRGTTLSAKSSGFSTPDFASLKESFDNVFNKMFYREAIVFLRDGNLWVMDSDGKNQRQLTKEGVGSWSVSKDGIIYKEKGAGYIFSSGNAKKFLDTDDWFYPVISLDGSKVALVRADEKFSATEAQELISKGYNSAYYKEGFTKKTGIYIFDINTRVQKRVVGELPANLSPDVWGGITEWIDYSLLWSPDGKKLHFSRDFMPYAEKGGYRDAYLIDISSGDVEHIGGQGRHILDWVDDKIIYTEESYSYIYNIAEKKAVQGLEEFYRYPTVSYLHRYGEKVLFSASEYNNEVLFVYNLKSNKYKSITTVQGHGSLRGGFSHDGKKIIYGYQSNLWTIDTDGNNKKKIEFDLPLSDKRAAWGLNNLLWISDGKRILIDLEGKSPANEISSIWVIAPDGSNLKKLADNASSSQWTALPRVSFISPNVAKTIILATIALSVLLLLFGMALITRKMVKAAISKIPKSKPTPKTKSIFCPQCGKENSASASFCTGCGQKLK